MFGQPLHSCCARLLTLTHVVTLPQHAGHVRFSLKLMLALLRGVAIVNVQPWLADCKWVACLLVWGALSNWCYTCATLGSNACL